MISTKEAQQQLNDKTKRTTIVFVDEYQGDKSKHKFKCTICNHKWESTPNTLKRSNNIGCSKCNAIKEVQIQKQQKEKKRYSKKSLPGSKKLREGETEKLGNLLPSKEITNKKNELKQFRVEQQCLLDQLPSLKRDLLAKEAEYLNAKKNDWEFGLFALVLLPIWIPIAISQTNKNAPYQKAFDEAKKKYDTFQTKIDSLKYKSEWIQRDIKLLETKNKYKNNIQRLSGRLNITLGSKTNLYYFRFKWNGKDYYKIGISVNGISRRYTRWDGKGSLDIDEVFFEIPVYSAKKVEQLILHTFEEYKANDPNILGIYKGWTEVFTKDVLELDR